MREAEKQQTGTGRRESNRIEGQEQHTCSFILNINARRRHCQFTAQLPQPLTQRSLVVLFFHPFFSGLLGRARQTASGTSGQSCSEERA